MAPKQSVPKQAVSDVEQGKICAILAWIFPIGLIWYLVDEKLRKNKFAGFHVKQSLVLFIAAVIINVVGTVIPVIGWFIILPIGSILIFVLWVMGLISAASGTQKQLPIIGKFGEKFNF
ncbi:hypothetical protein J4463_01310 [Candidatus Pacearchaeota archaeon]|nr:hypothetical protein [Candidatus Pacearchaeota archaeon]